MRKNGAKVALVFGTRPQIIKCVPVIRECLNKGVDLTLINTGQHYDAGLSKVFFQGLNVPAPKFDLEVGSGPHGWQTGQIIAGVEKAVKELNPSVCLVPGDTNSAIGSALAAVKLKVPVAHLESGLRSFEEFMPEEINRKVIDHISQLLFAPTQNAQRNLKHEGIPSQKICLSGDTMYDLYLIEQKRISASTLPLNIDNEFVVATIHREENTENKSNLSEILRAIKHFSLPVVLPLHPRTRNKLEEFDLLNLARRISNLIMIDPVDYHSMMKLMQNSQFVVTDSGGVQKEAFMAQVPCITIRRRSEWTELEDIGSNVLVTKISSNNVLKAMSHVSKNRNRIVAKIKGARSPFGKGNAAVKVIGELMTRYG